MFFFLQHPRYISKEDGIKTNDIECWPCHKFYVLCDNTICAKKGTLSRVLL